MTQPNGWNNPWTEEALACAIALRLEGLSAREISEELPKRGHARRSRNSVIGILWAHAVKGPRKNASEMRWPQAAVAIADACVAARKTRGETRAILAEAGFVFSSNAVHGFLWRRHLAEAGDRSLKGPWRPTIDPKPAWLQLRNEKKGEHNANHHGCWIGEAKHGAHPHLHQRRAPNYPR